MPKYTLGDVAPNGLRVLLKNGHPTNATASNEVIFHDDANIFDGVFHGGVFHGGVFHGGVFRDGVFHGGVFHGGVFRDGVFHGGVFHGGWFHGGVFHGGWFHGGEFRDGWFHGGVFHDGWLPLQISGSKHFLNIPDGKTIQIGCKNGTPAWWRLNYKQVGKEQGYSEAQVAEYYEYIKLATKVIKGASAT